MPSLPVLTLANHFTLIVESGNAADPALRWRNTWDIHDPSGSSPAPSDTIFDKIILFHRANLRNDCAVVLLTLRHWSQGPQPFANRPFIWERVVGSGSGNGTKTSAPPAGYGAEGLGNQSIPGSGVLRIQRINTVSGKNANMYLRGLLDDADIVAETGGRYVFAPAANVTTPSFNTIVGATLLPFCNPVSGVELVNVHVGNHHLGPPFSTPLSTVVLVGPTQNKQTRKNPR